MSDWQETWPEAERGRYEIAKQNALSRLRHAIEQIEKDQHLNALYATTEAQLEMQRCFGLIRWSAPT